MNIKILIAAHKKYQMPDDGIYMPIHVGKSINPVDIGYTGDDTGDNISAANKNFCELTALYWGWKNLDVDYIGLAHYRRHFSYKRNANKWDSVMKKNEAELLLKEYDAILPKKRNYYIESLYSHYAHTHDSSQLDKTKKIIEDKYPDYIEYYDRVVNSRSAHMFNMMVMRKDIYDSYCLWLFDILFELKKQVDLSGMSAFDARLFGRVSEILLDVWILKNNINYTEVKCIHMEKINWFNKGMSFIKAKFLHKKYNGGF